MTIADFFTLVKQADLGPFDRILVPVSPGQATDPTRPKEALAIPERAATPKR